MIVVACAAGALLPLGPAWLKMRLGVDEVVTTLLLNSSFYCSSRQCSMGR
jgi:simple sugar transport system permease protein